MYTNEWELWMWKKETKKKNCVAFEIEYKIVDGSETRRSVSSDKRRVSVPIYLDWIGWSTSNGDCSLSIQLAEQIEKNRFCLVFIGNSSNDNQTERTSPLCICTCAYVYFTISYAKCQSDSWQNGSLPNETLVYYYNVTSTYSSPFPFGFNS